MWCPGEERGRGRCVARGALPAASARSHAPGKKPACHTHVRPHLAREVLLIEQRRLRSLASRAADFFGLGTPCALAVAGLAWQPAGCWLACGDFALASCEASAFVRSFWSHSHCARRRFPPVSSSSSTTSLLADHSAEPRSGGDDIVLDGCRGIFFSTPHSAEHTHTVTLTDFSQISRLRRRKR